MTARLRTSGGTHCQAWNSGYYNHREGKKKSLFNFPKDVLNVFIDIQTSKELIQMDTDKIITYGTFTMDDEKLTQS